MDRRTLETALLAALAVAAIAAGAATLPTATDVGAGGGGGAPVAGSGGGGLLPTPSEQRGPLVELPDLRPLAMVLLLLVVIATVVYVVLFRRELVRMLVGLAGLVLLLAVLFWLASLVDLDPAGLPAPGGFLFGEPAGSAGEPTRTTSPLVVLLAVLLVGGGVLALLVQFGTIEPPGRRPDEDAPSEEATAVGEAAGRAADRIEAAADLDNEIYRAWREMTALLDVAAPDSSTPGEFAATAVGAGMDREDVAELTRLFEDVRYGGDEPTAAAEERSIAILRRIEATYAPDDERGADG